MLENNTQGDAEPVAPSSIVFEDGPDTMVAGIKLRAEKMFSATRGSHDWEHTQRVLQLCRRIGMDEGVDMEVLLAAACLHDIGRACQDTTNGKICHAEKGRELACPIIEPLPITKERKENILHCIHAHRFRNPPAPATPEAKVLFDADKLDAIGAVGVARAFLFAGEVGARLHNPDVDLQKTRPYTREDTGFREFKVKLSRIKDGMLTREGTRIAGRRHAFMQAFFDRLQAEYRGKE